jgi:ribulose-5-phosphate 4-epimerase/fuculose-1-phosphate aldolase
VLVDEYDGAVNSAEAARKAIDAMGDGEMALLAGHGVFVLGSTVRAVHQRAVALEQRCSHAWHIRAAGGRTDSPLPQWWLDRMKHSDGNGFVGFWEAAVRAELRDDTTLLD